VKRERERERDLACHLCMAAAGVEGRCSAAVEGARGGASSGSSRRRRR
jgi:hypothetical protein